MVDTEVVPAPGVGIAPMPVSVLVLEGRADVSVALGRMDPTALVRLPMTELNGSPVVAGIAEEEPVGTLTGIVDESSGILVVVSSRGIETPTLPSRPLVVVGIPVGVGIADSV